MIKLNGHEIKPTIFPDKTSQVWKLPDNLIQKDNKVEWVFENESELIHVCQLGDLLYRQAEIYIPFLPYGRQDKSVTNDSTFALCTFSQIITMFYSTITTLDAHSTKWFTHRFKSIYPAQQIKFAIESTNCDSVCFPDKGAKERYEIPLRNITLDKKRNQSTGEIEGLIVSTGNEFIKNSNILIIDDICDGGRTFIEAAKLLYSLGASSVNLYTTHGIYSKGIQVLKDAKIDRIFNYKGEV